MYKKLVLTFSLLLVCSTVCGQWYKESFKVMGTQAHVEFWLAPEQSIQIARVLIEAVKDEMHRIDKEMSPYKVNSLLSVINRQASISPVKISPELFELLKVSSEVSKLSDGAFDITFASVGYKYDYRASKRPKKETIASALSSIDYSAVILDEKNLTVSFNQAAIKIDLGGIAKGFAVKQCLNILASNGVEHALVSAGGDTALIGDRLGRDWLVGIKHPRAEHKTAVQIPLNNEAISTSGDYERYFIEDGVRYHHIINPKTGDSARKVVSVSIIGKDATYVDALSTTVFVMGLSKGMALIDKLSGYEAIIIDNQQTMHFSKGLQQN
ncbi:MAG: FAD:protein FMN transferase [Colwellia sp.]|nr:FAD:protein FMN transferase [Colwellia sp.]